MKGSVHPEQNASHRHREGYRERLVGSLGMADHRLDLAGTPTAVLEGGEGPPIILLHGQGEFAATWLGVIPDLMERYRVVAPDLPGHGASGVEDGSLDESGMTEWLDALIDRACPEPPIVAAHLLGGAIAARYAALRGDRLRRLVLVDALGLAPYRPSPRFAFAMISFMAFPTASSRDRLFSRCFVDLDDVRRQVGDQWDALSGYALERAQSPELKRALRSLMPKFGLPRIPDEVLARIAVPTTLIWGRYDLQTRVSVAEQASQRFGWPLHVIEGAADDPAVEQPEAFLEAWEALLGMNEGRAERTDKWHSRAEV